MARLSTIGIALIGAGAAALAIALRPRRAAAAELEPCSSPPPGQQPPIPSGWAMYRGAVSDVARAQARASLSLPMGASTSFLDSDGAEVGILLMWHCHNPSEGVRPVGWHKGATLFRVG